MWTISQPCDFLLRLDGRFEAVLVGCGALEFSSVCFDEFLQSVSPDVISTNLQLTYPVFDIAASGTAVLRRFVRGAGPGCAGCGGLSATF